MATTYGNYASNYYSAPAYSAPTSQYRASAPTVQKSPATLQYSGPRQYSQYTQQNTNPMYSSYLQRQYANPNQMPTDSAGNTAYALRRQGVEQETENLRQRAAEDLERRLAAQNMQNSGMAFKQRRQLESDLGKLYGQQASNINIEELGALERQAERLGTQAFTAEQAGLERAEAQRQFDTSSDLQAATTRANLAQEAWKFENEEKFRRWAREQDIAEADIDRAWQAAQNERRYETDLQSRLAGIFATADVEADAEERKAVRDQTVEYYNAAGQAGNLSPEELESLRTSNPVAYYAYKAGESGKTVDETKADADLQFQLRQALITTAGDDPKTRSALINLAQRWGYDVGDWGIQPGATPGEAPAGGLSTDSYEYQERINGAKPFTPSVEYYTGGGKDNGWYFNSLPAKGDDFVFQGRLYTRTDDDTKIDKSGPNTKETEYFMVEDVETGEILRIDAKRWSNNPAIKEGASGFPTMNAASTSQPAASGSDQAEIDDWLHSTYV